MFHAFPRRPFAAFCFTCLLALTALPAQAIPLIVAGGNGADGTGAGAGADSPNSPALFDSGTSFDSIDVSGGNGGNGGGGFSGGKGGDVEITLDAPTVTTSYISVRGGAAGNTGTGKLAGDVGGKANLIFDAGTTVTSTTGVLVSSSSDGASGAWSGIPSLVVRGTLIAPSVTVDNSLNAGDIWAKITQMDVNSVDTALTSIGLTSAGNFTINDANLSNGHQLSINNGAGKLAVERLNVSGSGRLFVADGASTNQSISTLNADNANLTFVLPSTLQNGGTFATVTNANLNGTNIGLDYQSVRPNLTMGQGFVLLEAKTALNTDITTMTVQAPGGDTYTLRVSGNQLLAVLGSFASTSPAYERLKAYAESRAAALGFVNQGTDLILSQALGSALLATKGTGAHSGSFAAASGGWSRYNTGSHADVSGASMLAGVAAGNDMSVGRLTAGLFFEGGLGSYNSYNSFSDYASVKGSGDTSYYGGGALGRFDVKKGELSGAYVDASARLGRADADFSSGDIRYNGNKVNFDTASLYFGAHAGAGYQWSFTDKALLDLSGKLIWTHQNSDAVSVDDDKVRFKGADSLRTRMGGRFNYAMYAHAAPYAGAYWEHEFDGKQSNSVNGVATGSPSLKGDTGVGEIGLMFKPVKDSGFFLDLGLQGYVGAREGATGNLQVKLAF